MDSFTLKKLLAIVDSYFKDRELIEFINIFIVIFISIMAGFINYLVLLSTTKRFKKENFILKYLFDKKNIKTTSFFITFIILKYFLSDIYKNDNLLKDIVDVVLINFMSIIIRHTISSIKDYYSNKKNYTEIAINSFFELINISIIGLTIIISISIIFNININSILGTLGALTAVIILIFKDIILGFVAGIQIYYNKTIKIGDWIELKDYSADGEIIEIKLVNSKVLNWDKTITIVPTYTLISTGVKNWDNLSRVGVRRIKRNILIDIDSIKFFTEQEYKNLLNKYDFLKEVNYKELTNLTIFRMYAENYLKNRKDISRESTLMVRQLSPNNNGVPIQIYCFTNTPKWVEYEHIQGEIIDYFIVKLKGFDLDIFQSIKNINGIR